MKELRDTGPGENRERGMLLTLEKSATCGRARPRPARSGQETTDGSNG
jgi:hypothetical protein